MATSNPPSVPIAPSTGVEGPTSADAIPIVGIGASAGRLDDCSRLLQLFLNYPGLAPEQRHHVFERFYSTKPSGDRIGTAIAKSMLEPRREQGIRRDEPGMVMLLLPPRIEP